MVEAINIKFCTEIGHKKCYQKECNSNQN